MPLEAAGTGGRDGGAGRRRTARRPSSSATAAGGGDGRCGRGRGNGRREQSLAAADGAVLAPELEQAAANAGDEDETGEGPGAVRLFIVLSWWWTGPSLRPRPMAGMNARRDMPGRRGGGRGQVDRHDDRVPTGGAVRERLGPCVRSGSRLRASVARASIVWFPLGGVPFEDPLAPGVDRVDGRQPSGLAMARRRRGPRRDRCRGAAPRRRRRWRPCPRATRPNGFGVSIRAIVLIGRFLRPAALDPVRVKGVERGELELDQPLGGRDVAVQAGHDQPDRDSRGRPAAAPRSSPRRASRRDRRARPRSGCRS